MDPFETFKPTLSFFKLGRRYNCPNFFNAFTLPAIIFGHTMRRIFIAFIIFATLLTIAFLWNELDGLDIHKTINSEKVGNYFTALGAVAAAISIYFLYGQLLEMRDTRKAAYQPDLYPNYSKFKVKDVVNSTIFDGGDKPVVKVIRLEDNQPQEQFGPYIELHNIGLGAAKNISSIWKYNVDEVENLIRGIYQHYKVTEPEKEHFDFLQTNSKTFMDIPFYFFNCCGEQLNQTYLDVIEPVNEKPKPELTLQIRYQDIQNNWFDKCFNVSVTAFTEFVDLKFSADE